VWPAFWLVTHTGSDYNAEIDVVEYYGKFPDRYHATSHLWPKAKGVKPQSREKVILCPKVSLTEAFHTSGSRYRTMPGHLSRPACGRAHAGITCGKITSVYPCKPRTWLWMAYRPNPQSVHLGSRLCQGLYEKLTASARGQGNKFLIKSRGKPASSSTLGRHVPEPFEAANMPMGLQCWVSEIERPGHKVSLMSIRCGACMSCSSSGRGAHTATRVAERKRDECLWICRQRS
jgi:hypothetical protein